MSVLGSRRMSDPFSRLVMSVMRSATVARSHAYQVRVYSPPWMAGRVMGRGPYWRVSSMRPLMMSGYEPVMVRARPLDGCCSSTRIGPSRQVSLSPRGRTRRFDRRVRPPPQSRERLRVSAFHVYEVRGAGVEDPVVALDGEDDLPAAQQLPQVLPGGGLRIVDADGHAAGRVQPVAPPAGRIG